MAAPNTRIRTTHAMKIVVNGRTIGLIRSYNRRQSRTISREFEINADSDGDAVELVPGNLDNHSITFERTELYAQFLEEEFGFADISMLTKQENSFEIHEVWKKPDGTIDGFRHVGCWIAEIGINCPSDGARIVRRDGTIQVLKSFPVVS